MKKLLVLIGLAVMLLPVFLLAQKSYLIAPRAGFQIDGTQLQPHFWYHTPDGWNDVAETPDTDIKRYYWDGTGDDGNGLEFEDEDTLLLITFNKDGQPVSHKLTNAYKVQLQFQRSKTDGSFGTCYLYKLNNQ